MDITKLTLLEAKKGLLEKKFSSTELTEEFIKNIEKNRHLNAFITETFDLARQRAKESDEKISKGQAKKLEGLPIAMKDIFCTKSIKTTAGSKYLENFIPPYESTVSERMDKEGYVLLGKTNMDEFAAAGTGKTSHFGPAINPYKANNDSRDLIPGGSSSGSAAALAGNMCLASTGSDTGDSTRHPANLCNLVGIKPTYGRISRYGMIAYASSLDHAGLFTRDIRDSAYLLEIIAGKDDKDSTSADVKVPNYLANLNSNIKGRTVGIIKEYEEFLNLIEPDVKKTYLESIEVLKKGGAIIKEISITTVKATSLLYTVLSYTELGSNLARYDGVRFGSRTNQDVKTLDDLYYKSRTEAFCENIKKRILLGYHLSSTENYEKYFIKAQKVRRKMVNEFYEAFKQVDVILSPVGARIAFPVNPTEAENKIISERGAISDYLAITANMCGLPAISVPRSFSSTGLPIGMQLMGKHFDEQSIFDFGLFFEENK